MSQPSTPVLPAPINSAGKSITQRLSDLEAAVNNLITYLPTRASSSDMQALKSTLDADRRAGEARHQELLKAVAQSAQPPLQFPDLSGLQKEVRAHSEAISKLQNAPNPVPTTVDTTALEGAVQALDERVLELETRPTTPPHPDATPLEARVTILEDLLGLTTPTDPLITATTDTPSAPLNEVQDA